jgi:serine/threonine protein kinase
VLDAADTLLPAPDLRRLGRYEVLCLLATGGMAEIFIGRARGPESFEKIVVLKRLRPLLLSERDALDLFLHEARLAATLHHPNIVQVYETGVDESSYFIAMEYVHGETLAALLKQLAANKQPIALDIILAVITSICAGLHHAHEQRGADNKPLNIVHRDVSPSNILLGFEGSVKLVDFGIAKATTRSHETTKGVLRGKAAYMAPEQVEGERLDRRADLFSLSVVFYEMLTLTRLFGGAKSDFEVLEAVMDKPVPPPSTLRPDIPAEIDRIVLKGLAREREARYQTGEELQAELEAFARQHQLSLSILTLRRFVQSVFGERVEAWRNAERHGVSLADHVVKQVAPTPAYGIGRNPPITPAPPAPAPPTARSATQPTGVLLDLAGVTPRRPWRLIAAAALLGVAATAVVMLGRPRAAPRAVAAQPQPHPVAPATVEPRAEPQTGSITPPKVTKSVAAPPHPRRSEHKTAAKVQAGKDWDPDSLWPP